MRDMIGSTIPEWLDAYRGSATPESLVGELLDRVPPGDIAFISRISRDDLTRQLAALAVRRKAAGDGLDVLPLYGVPFAVKDNIDVEGLPTTAACPEFAYAPTRPGWSAHGPRMARCRTASTRRMSPAAPARGPRPSSRAG